MNMTRELVLSVLPIFAFAINVASQIYICRYVKKAGLLNSVFAGFAIGMISLVFFDIFRLRQDKAIADKISFLIVDVLSCSALGYCYMHFINLGQTARRIRLLRELASAPDGLSLEGILSRYNAKEMVERRILRLLKSGQAIYRDNRYYPGKPIMLVGSRITVFLKFLLFGKGSEFDA